MANWKSLSVRCGAAVLSLLTVHAGEFPDEWTYDSTPERRTQHAALEGKRMPPFSVTNWINGQLTSADIKGKVLVVDLYATWCGPCMAAIPHNNELVKKYRNKGLVLIGICTSSRGQEKFLTNAREKGIQYLAARDPEEKTAKAWGVLYYPTYAVVDRKGIVRVVGLHPGKLEEVVTKLLAEPAT